MLQKIHPRWAGWLVAFATIASAGCTKYPALAAQYAHVEEATATAVLPYASLAYRSCRKNAAYRYFNESLHGEMTTPRTGLPWLSWYAAAPFEQRPQGGSVTWQAECDVERQEGASITTLLRVLRSHGRAVAAVAEGRDLDTSALQSVGTKVGSVGTQLGQSASFSSTASGAGGAIAAVTANLATIYKTRKLEDAFADTNECMQTAFGVLDRFGNGVQGRLDSLTQLRSEVIALLNVQRSKASFAQVAALADAYEFVGADDLDLDALKAEVARDRQAISRLGVAHAKLAELAKTHAAEAQVAAALDDLEMSTDQLLESAR